MKDFEAKTICILGRQPALGLAELESLYGEQHVRPGPYGTALLNIDGFDINFQNLGGTIKVARILNSLLSDSWPAALEYLKEKIPAHLQSANEGKFTLGVSLYGLGVNWPKLNRDLLGLKKVIKNSGRSVRLVPNKALALSSAQVLHNKLTKRGAWELLLVKDGPKTIVAQTLFIQDIEAYAARDQVRPARDARVGMLPPKLAQILINLACPLPDSVILDPFCGSGVILQEALLMGHGVIGTDIEPRMVDYARQNLDWLDSKFDGQIPKFKLGQADATDHKWQESFDTVVSELYLGRPLGKLPPQNELEKIINDVNTIIKKFLANISSQLKNGTRISLAVPAWIDGSRIIHLPLIDAFDSVKPRSASALSVRPQDRKVERVDHLTDMGYNRYDFVHVKSSDLAYYREGQIVARELLVLIKR